MSWEEKITLLNGSVTNNFLRISRSIFARPMGKPWPRSTREPMNLAHFWYLEKKALALLQKTLFHFRGNGEL